MRAHVVKSGIDESYRPRDVEFHRGLYRTKAMPFLTLETATPTETHKQIIELREQLKQKDQRVSELETEMAELREIIKEIKTKMDTMTEQMHIAEPGIFEQLGARTNF